MRVRFISVFVILLGIFLVVSAQDFDDSGLKIADQTSATPTNDQYELTSTALVIQATRTARSFTRVPTNYTYATG